MKETGGFFSLELRKGNEYHPDALGLNSGRSCLEYILKAKGFQKIYLPSYICDTVYQPLLKLGINYEEYSIDKRLEPIFNKQIKPDEAILYVNYFGLKQSCVNKLAERKINLIVDNTQAFFAKPVKGLNTFYSPRKFFGVPDGGYLYSTGYLAEKLGREKSYHKCIHLLKRTDIDAKSAFKAYQNNEKSLALSGIKLMSNLTAALLRSIDYRKIKEDRNSNFRYIHGCLVDINLLKFDTDDLNGPMVYPLLVENEDLRSKLIENKVYIPTYWENVLENTKIDQFEYKLASGLLPLPIDQRYGKSDMEKIVQLIKG